MEQIKPTLLSWSFTKKTLFRFCFLLFALFIFITPADHLPYIEKIYEFYSAPFYKIIPWIGKHILHLPYDITAFSNGSGDTTYDYVLLLFITVVAIAGCIAWTLLDRRRASHNTLQSWFIIGVRYYIAFVLFSYGFEKIFKLQFDDPGPWELTESYGESSPMGLAWSFFGYSKGYNYFIGLAELIPGILLLFSRTRRAAALFSLAVTSNVMAVNFFFDVPVKIFSTMLVVMSLFLVLQDRKHYVNFFFYNRQAEPGYRFVPGFKKKWLDKSFIILKYVLIASVLYNNVSFCLGILKKQGSTSKPLLYGMYNVETFVKNKDTLAPLTTDTLRWRKFIVYYPGYSAVKFMNDSTKFYRFNADTLTKKIVLHKSRDTTKATLVYSFIGEDNLLLQGKWLDGDSVRITLKQYDLNKYLLINRGFHFINEYPLNR